MTSYRSKATAWAKGDKVLHTHFETVEDNADTALQLHDATTILPSVHAGTAFTVAQTFENTVTQTRVEASGATVEVDFGTCQTGDILQANASFYAYTGSLGSYFSLSIAASGSFDRVHTLGVTSASTYVVSLTGYNVVASANTGKRHIAALYVENMSSSGTTAIRGEIGMSGMKYRPNA